jgi:hypothetical protein
MAYILPQVLVFQEFDITPAGLTGTLNAHISGPHAFLLRYADPTEKDLAYLGAYDPLNGLVSNWPQRPPGGLVDTTYTKIYIDNALLQYFQNLMGSGDTVVPVAANKVQLNSPTYGFVGNGTAYPRLPALYDRDVQPGDRVHIRGAVASVNYDLDTYVTAIESNPVSAVVGAAYADQSNGPTQAATSSASQTAGTDNSITLAADTTTYSALTDGALSDTYTVTVINGSVGGDFTTAQLRITTASGNDDVLAIAPAAAGTAFPVGNRGLLLTFSRTLATDDLIAGQTFEVQIQQAYTAIVATSAGTYRGSQSTTYVIQFTQGGMFNAADPALRPQFSAITVHGTDSSPPLPVDAPATAYPVGTQGVTVHFGASPDGVRKGDRFYVPVTGAQDGQMNILVLANNLPAQLWTPTPATDLDLTLSVERDIMVDEMAGGITNWTQSDIQIILNAGIEAYDESFTQGGEPYALPVMSGLVYVEYRAWVPELSTSVGAIYDVGDLDALISGPLTPDNPLKWGVFKALSNSNGTNVMFTSVADPADIDSWDAVLALLIGRTDVYNLVPLTFDRTVLDLYAAHVDDESSPEQARWRALFGSIQATTQAAIVSQADSTDGNVVMATIAQDPQAVGNDFIMLTVPAQNSGFLTNQVQPSDIVRTNYGVDQNGNEIYDEYVVDIVLNEDSLQLMSGPAEAVTVAQKIEIWRYLSKDEIAADLATQAGSFGDRRVKMVWPDTVGSGGILQEGYHLAAALAGLRSGVVPQQGLTNVQVMGFDDLSRTTDFLSGAQLNTMATAGTWIVTQAPDGTVYNRHALTTDNTDVNSSEEMVTSNLDSISYTFANQLAPYIGRMNVTPSALLVLGTEIDSVIDYLKSNGYVPRLGGQLVDATIISLQPHAILADRVVCVIDVTLPYPMNNLELHLVV